MGTGLEKKILGNKIAIIGSAGVGKTTLLTKLFEDPEISANYSRIDEVVRILCAEKGFKSPYEIEGDIHKFREEILLRQIELENQSESFVVDRSTIDAWAYYMRWSWNYTSVEDAENFYQLAYNQAQKYDQLIYLPIRFEIEDDGFRWANKTYQKQIDRIIISIVNDWGLSDKLLRLTSENQCL